jgi:hypothetical protein
MVEKTSGRRGSEHWKTSGHTHFRIQPLFSKRMPWQVSSVLLPSFLVHPGVIVERPYPLHRQFFSVKMSMSHDPFDSLHKSVHFGVPMGALALSVKSLTSTIPGTSLIPAETILGLDRISDILEVLKIAGAMRPMCLNCQHLRSLSGGFIDDYAIRLSGPQWS